MTLALPGPAELVVRAANDWTTAYSRATSFLSHSSYNLSGYNTCFFPVVDRANQTVRLGAVVMSPTSHFKADATEWLFTKESMQPRRVNYRGQLDHFEVQWGSISPDDHHLTLLSNLAAAAMPASVIQPYVCFLVQRFSSDTAMVPVTGDSFGLAFAACIMGLGPSLYTGTGMTFTSDGNLALESAQDLPEKVAAAKIWGMPFQCPGSIGVVDSAVSTVNFFVHGAGYGPGAILSPTRISDMVLFNYRLAAGFSKNITRTSVISPEVAKQRGENKEHEWNSYLVAHPNPVGEAVEALRAAVNHLNSIGREDEADSLKRSIPDDKLGMKLTKEKNIKAVMNLIHQAQAQMDKKPKPVQGAGKVVLNRSGMGSGFEQKFSKWRGRFQ